MINPFSTTPSFVPPGTQSADAAAGGEAGVENLTWKTKKFGWWAVYDLCSLVGKSSLGSKSNQQS